MIPSVESMFSEQLIRHVINFILLIALLAPVLMVALKLKRRKVIIIQCFIEVAYFLSLIAYLMDGFYSGVTIDYILNTINTYKGEIFVWLVHFIFLIGLWFRFIRKLSDGKNDQQDQSKLTQKMDQSL
jgi:hypothetical protein